MGRKGANGNGGELNEMQARFCEEYVKDLNGKHAAIRAGYSEDTAEVQASRLLRHAKVKHKIDALLKERSKRTAITADTVLQELLKLARVDIGGAFNDDGSLKPIKDIPEEIRRAISGIDIVEEFDGQGSKKVHIGYTKKIKFWDKAKALELLGKHLKLFTEKVEVEGKVTLEQLVLGSKQSEDDSGESGDHN